MSKQLLIYETAVPVSSARHANCSVAAGTDFGFARHINSVPLTAVEFGRAAAEYPIVFAGSEEALMPAVVLGVRANENVFLDAENNWKGRYVPAFVRRYPFVFSSSEDGQTLTLCIDEAFPGFNREGRGQALFDADGNPSAYTKNVLRFVQEYQNQFLRTQNFCKKLQELNLLESVQAQITLPKGELLSLTGFMAVNRDKLKALPTETLVELLRTDALELIFAHLASLAHFEDLKDRLVASQPTADRAPVEEKVAVEVS